MNTFARGSVLSFALIFGAMPAVAQDVAFDLYNNSSHTIYYFYTSPSNQADWGDDLLGSDVLYSGEAASVDIFDGSDQCLYDFWFETDTGLTLEEYGIDICTLSSYTVTD